MPQLFDIYTAKTECLKEKVSEFLVEKARYISQGLVKKN